MNDYPYNPQSETGLNDNHKRQLLVTFQYIDKILSEALNVLITSELSSPFNRYIPDSLPLQRKIIADYLASLRKIMIDALERHEIELPQPTTGSIWAFQTALMSARNNITELRPKYMHGYGHLSPDVAHDIDLLASKIDNILMDLHTLLAEETEKGLQELLCKQESISDE